MPLATISLLRKIEPSKGKQGHSGTRRAYRVIPVITGGDRGIQGNLGNYRGINNTGYNIQGETGEYWGTRQ